MISAPGRPSAFIDGVVLNSVQKEAVLYDAGPQLVFAGAGTGKTRVLTAKMSFLIREKGISPHNVFAATFTNKAAREMRERVESLTGLPMSGLWIGTFHSLCARLLRREASRLGFSPSFSIFDADDALSQVKKTARELQLDERTMPPKTLLSAISRYKNACIPPQSLAGKQGSYFEQECVRVYTAYQESLARQQAMDFDDLLARSVYLLRGDEDVRRSYQSLFRYVLVDEYQDTNLAQFHLVKLLAGAENRVFVVGDDDQSIYAWRGANVDNILSFEKVFPGTKVFKLEQNYRSTEAILSFANAAIAPNAVRAAKELWTAKKGGRGVVVTRHRDDRTESESVCDAVSAALSRGVKAGDMAILFRTNAQSRLFEDSMRKRRLPYVLIGGMSFYERREIKDCLAYLRLCVNPSDDLSFERILNVPPRGLGDKSRELLVGRARQAGASLLDFVRGGEAAAAVGNSRAQKGLSQLKEVFSLLLALVNDHASPHELCSEMLTLTGYLTVFEGEDSEEAEARIENVNELLNALAIWTEENPARGLAEFLEEISLVSDLDSWEKKDEAVNLMTLHCAKGLEFSTVFIVGCEDGILPSRQNFDDEAKIEEERRLLYVGITRAMDTLECSYADQRFRFGNLLPMPPSRFLSAIPEDRFTFVDRSGFFAAHAREERRQPRGFAAAPDRRQWAPAGEGSPPPRAFSQEAARKVAQPFPPDDFSQDTVQYRMGQQVAHKIYGPGKIVNLSGFGDDMRMTVLFNDGSRRKLMAKFADFETL
jgi:DNA helicase II / ATP-dependent DNA helicase PcrA